MDDGMEIRERLDIELSPTERHLKRLVEATLSYLNDHGFQAVLISVGPEVGDDIPMSLVCTDNISAGSTISMTNLCARWATDMMKKEAPSAQDNSENDNTPE